MIEREMRAKLEELALVFPVVSLLGPRQSGKTTLSQAVFPDHTYLNLEELDVREFATNDPRSFLETYCNGSGVILDEVQYVPELFSYIQARVDRLRLPGQFILTGSQNFLLNERISQTLAGRCAILTLLPLSFKEQAPLPDAFEKVLFQGGYPSIQVENVKPVDWYLSYIRTYVERDVRQVKNVTDLGAFQRFLKLCAGRTGQLVNWTEVGRDCGISHNTARAWASLLEASYLIFLLPSYHNNVTTRVIKSPKLYFYDTGLACSLLGIESEKQLTTHYLKGGLFESFIMAELIKKRMNQGRAPNCYFWRDKMGHEVDCVIESPEGLVPVEIKAGRTIASDYFDGLTYWNEKRGSDPRQNALIYGGQESQSRDRGRVIPWQRASDVIA